MLRLELVKLMSRVEPVRNRTQSTGSDKLSSDGHDTFQSNDTLMSNEWFNKGGKQGSFRPLS